VWRVVIPLGVVVGWVLAASAAPTAGRVGEPAHSGAVIAIDAHRVTLEEMGRWAPREVGKHRLTVAVTPGTRIELVSRQAKAPAGQWPGGYVETPGAVTDIHPGDFVTVRTAQHGRQTVADTIELVRPSAAAALN
jgi:hypothetical protein